MLILIVSQNPLNRTQISSAKIGGIDTHGTYIAKKEQTKHDSQKTFKLINRQSFTVSQQQLLSLIFNLIFKI